MNSASARVWTLLVGSLAVAMTMSTTGLAQPDPFGGPRSRPSLPGTTKAPARQLVEEEKLEVEGGIVVAFLNLDRSPLGMLVEAKLRSKKIVNWWRRGATVRLVDDLELSTAIDIPPLVEDRDPPKLPDALILCRTRIQDKDRTCEIVVCEPGLGLRLGAVRLLLTKDVGADVATLADGAVKSLAKLGEEMKELWGVVPLRNKDLGSKYDSLRTQLAGVAEEELFRRKGALLVELEYAHAVALARKHAGITEPVKRATPIYLTGQYRNSGLGEKRTLAITLQVAGSDAAKTDNLPATGLLPAEAEKSLRERVQAIAKDVGGSQEIRVKETADEISKLATLSKEFQTSGDVAARSYILEASLLLKPQDPPLAWESVRLLGERSRVHWESGRDIIRTRQVTEALPGGGTGVKNVPNENMEFQIQEGLTAMTLYRRGLFRIRDLLEGVEKEVVVFNPIEFMTVFPMIVSRPETPKGYVAVNQQLSRQQRAIALRLVVRDANQGRTGPLLGWDEMTPQERMQVVLRLIVELQDQPRAEQRTFSYVLNGVQLSRLKTPEGEVFLKQLAEIPNPAVQTALVKLKEAVDKNEVPRTPTRLPEPPEVEDKDADVRFVPLSLDWRDIPINSPGLSALCELVVPVGKNGDLFCRDGQILLMKEKGKTKLLFDAKEQGYSFRQLGGGYGISPAYACYDGRYAWVPMLAHGKAARLLIVDPEKEKVTEFKPEDGLPSEPPEKNFTPALEAGSLEPGKAILVGSFGKAWVGIAAFDGEKPTVKIIHEAQEQYDRNNFDQWRSKSLAFNPAYLLPLSDAAIGKEKRARRFLIGRASPSFEALKHPLLLDPDSGKAEVLQTALHPGQMSVMTVHDGAIYWVQHSSSNDTMTAEFMRLGFPDLAVKSLGKQPLPGKGHMLALGIDDKGLHVFHDQWLTAEKPGDPLKPLKGNLPKNDRTSWRYLVRSNHYGWIVLAINNQMGYAVEFGKKEEAGQPTDSGKNPKPDPGK